MSWTDNSINQIRNISENIKITQNDVSSYLPMMEYGFKTPVELKKMLEDMWEEIGKIEMKDFSDSICIAAFNSRSTSSDIDISPFNYEF